MAAAPPPPPPVETPKPAWPAPPPQQHQAYVPPQQAYAPPPQQQYYAPPPPSATPPPPAWQTHTAAAPAAPPQQQVYTIADQPKKGIPGWLAALLTLLVLGGGLYGVYRFFGSGGAAGEPVAKAKQESAGAAVAEHPYLKQVEVTGFRILETPAKKAMFRFVVINHSNADLSGLGLRVTLTTNQAKPEDPPVAVVDVKVGDIAAYGSKDMEAALDTKLRIYELPDWQFIKASFEITAPK